jgi:hypothetical protein
MKQTAIISAFLVALLLAATAPRAWAQADRDVKKKQSELKDEYNQAQEKNQIIRAAANDKPRPTTGRARRGNTSTGYDYTQVKGFTLKQTGELYQRIDKMFMQANDLSIFEEPYRADGTFPVPGRKGLGSSQMRTVEVYYVEATAQEIEAGAQPYDIIEVRVQKLETLPPEETVDEGEEEAGLGGIGGGMGGGEPVAKGFTLSGEDLWTMVKISDEALFSDILSRRGQSPSIPLPADLFLPAKVGPFIIMTSRELETTTSRFIDFWNERDTLRNAVSINQTGASGPLFMGQVPVLYPELTKLRIQNTDKDKPLKLTTITFVGDNATEFEVKAKVPQVLEPKQQEKSKVDIEYNYVGSSPYETRGQLLIEAKEANLSQTIDIWANPGNYVSDFATLDLSLDKLEIRSPSRSHFAPDWNVAYTMGYDPANLPRWTSGTSSLSVGYKHDMSIGLVLPMNMITPGMPGPLGFEGSLLQSPMGYNVDFDFSYGFPFSVGGHILVTNDFDVQDPYQHMRLLSSSVKDKTDPTIDYTNDFFHLGTVAQVFYPIMFKDRQDDPNIAVRLEIGGGYLRVQRDHLVMEGETMKEGREFSSDDYGKLVTLGKQSDYFDVYVRMAFMQLGAKNNYGIGLQYFQGRMMADAFLELTNWLRVDAKYSFLLREREVWETETSTFLLTPRLRLGLPSIFN